MCAVVDLDEDEEESEAEASKGKRPGAPGMAMEGLSMANLRASANKTTKQYAYLLFAMLLCAKRLLHCFLNVTIVDDSNFLAVVLTTRLAL